MDVDTTSLMSPMQATLHLDGVNRRAVKPRQQSPPVPDGPSPGRQLSKYGMTRFLGAEVITLSQTQANSVSKVGTIFYQTFQGPLITLLHPGRQQPFIRQILCRLFTTGLLTYNGTHAHTIKMPQFMDR
jgi:hypothetical protein